MTSDRRKITTEELIAELKSRGMSADDILNAITETTTTTQHKPLEVVVTELLHSLGIPAHLKGYRYVRRAVILAMETPEISMTKELYPSIAKEFRTTASRVERGIRHAIEVAWERGDTESINDIFGYSVSCEKGKPTNSEFIYMLADKLCIERK